MLLALPASEGLRAAAQLGQAAGAIAPAAAEGCAPPTHRAEAQACCPLPPLRRGDDDPGVAGQTSEPPPQLRQAIRAGRDSYHSSQSGRSGGLSPQKGSLSCCRVPMLSPGEEAPSRARCHAHQDLPQSSSKPVKRPDLSAVSPSL